MLDRDARRELLTLSKSNGEAVARHLVMAGLLLEDDPETAYQHAQAAGRGAGRVAVAREGVAITAYATGRYAEALKELRAVRRLSGRDEHRIMEADCERGLGRPERALQIIAETDQAALSPQERAELAIVASGARADLGEHETGLLILRSPALEAVTEPAVRVRLDQVIADRLDELGRTDEAQEIRDRLPTADTRDDAPFEVYDLATEDVPEEQPVEHEHEHEHEPVPVPESVADEVPEVVPEPGADAELDPATNDGTDEAPEEESSAEQTHSEETPSPQTPPEEALAEEAPAEDTPSEEAPAEEAPAETGSGEVRAEEPPAEETPSEEAPADEAIDGQMELDLFAGLDGEQDEDR